MDWLEKPIDPTHLLLAWQAPDGQKDRRRWTVGMLWFDRGLLTFRYFDRAELEALNFGRTEEELRRVGFAGYPAFQYEPGRVYDKDVLSAFLRRLPPATRADFAQYETYFSIRPGSMLPPLTLLGITEARLPSDGFSLVDPLSPDVSEGDAIFEIAGYRYQDVGQAPAIGDRIELSPDPTNEHDPNAIEVLWQGSRIGFVNRLQAVTIGQWLRSREVECSVLRLNGRAGAPRAYAKITVRPKQSEIAA